MYSFILCNYCGKVADESDNNGWASITGDINIEIIGGSKLKYEYLNFCCIDCLTSYFSHIEDIGYVSELRESNPMIKVERIEEDGARILLYGELDGYCIPVYDDYDINVGDIVEYKPISFGIGEFVKVVDNV